VREHNTYRVPYLNTKSNLDPNPNLTLTLTLTLTYYFYIASCRW